MIKLHRTADDTFMLDQYLTRKKRMSADLKVLSGKYEIEPQDLVA